MGKVGQRRGSPSIAMAEAFNAAAHYVAACP
jgi:hypothetical protein